MQESEEKDVKGLEMDKIMLTLYPFQFVLPQRKCQLQAYVHNLQIILEESMFTWFFVWAKYYLVYCFQRYLRYHTEMNAKRRHL